ncbi:hypothetical protein [Flavivirga spongiicola]|uniref:Uncharacterized protein n=1 Tax=Flavivirga spongiicola TaxID=421621 RepID=A0ABU7XNK0_9FLAO|nr:hypothetical protein [Flavivirga sp. MEBiC05379]MDO5977334.1 hypothetical protein [Flavivirga sp. MEBiC05379]
MGLAEKRVVKAFQEGTYKELESKILETLGKQIEIEVNWNSLAKDGMSHLYEEAFPKVYFFPLIKALENICADDMGKEAIAESLNKIVIEHKDNEGNTRAWSSFSGGVLTLDAAPTTNIDLVSNRAESLQELLENSL